MNQKGQLTAFIIIGVVMVAGGLLWFMMFDIETEVPGADSVGISVNSCLARLAGDAVTKIGRNGGFIELVAEPHIDKVAYAKKDELILLPELEDIENAAASYITENIAQCAGMGRDDLQARSPQAEVEFTEKEVVARMTYPITITSSTSATDISEFSARLPIRFRKMHEMAYTIITHRQIDLTFLGESDIDTSIYSHQGTLIYVLRDNGFEFYFAATE
jgi:hypothetical protein